jgi:hypothetical protein
VDKSKRQAIQFLEKEIKTYKALALFLSKDGVKEHVKVANEKALISPVYYKDRMKEAKKIVSALKK